MKEQKDYSKSLVVTYGHNLPAIDIISETVHDTDIVTMEA